MLIGINAQKLFATQDYRNAGISRYIGGLVRHLPRLPGDERYLLYTGPHVRAWPDLESARLRIASTRLPTTHPVLRILWEQTALAALAARDGIDLLHCPQNVRPLGATVAVVVTIHDLTFIRYPDRFDPLRRRYLATFTRYSARHAARVLADSDATRRDVVAAFGLPADRVHVVYPGVDEDFRPYDPRHPADRKALQAFRARHQLPERFILYLGTLEPRKNVDRLVLAYGRLAAAGLPHFLVLAGGKGWNYQAIFRAIEQQGLQDRVIVAGYVARAEQPLWYNAADLFVYPSQYEGFGLPPLEAMACGVPVVTSDTSSLPEVVGTAGATVDPGDVEALTETMRAVLSDGARAAAMRAQGLRQAARFTWQAAAASCLAAYRAAADDRHRA